MTGLREKFAWGLVTGLCLLVVAAVSGVIEGGTLDPPGPIGPSMKSLDEVEPRIEVNALPGSATAVRVISQPGSYYLTADVEGETGKHGIVIDSDNVSLDLNGFSVVSNVANTLDGITVTNSIAYNIEVKNGRVVYWYEDGIDLLAVEHARISNVESSWNTLDGIRVGRGSTITDCVSTDNNGDGIRVDGALVTRCNVYNSGADGVETAGDSYIHDNVLFANWIGVHATGSRNRIDSNQITQSNTPLDIDLGNNLIVRNTIYSVDFPGAANSIAAGNAVGPFVSGGAPITTADPWANFLVITQ